MQNFIVLGIIPGTHYQTTFIFWVYVALAFVGIILVARVLSLRHTVRAYFAARKIHRYINRNLQTA